MRWIIRIVGTLVVLVAIFAGAALLVPTERIAGLAADRFEAATGRTMRIDGPVRATLWPGLAVRMERVTVANPDWVGDAPLLDAGTVEVGMPLSAIWGGPVRIETLEIRDAVVTLVRDVGGAESWDLARPGGGSGGGGGSHGGSTLVPVERAFLAGAEVVYEDRAAGTGWRLRAVDLEARLPDAAGALDLVGSALIGGQAVAMEAQVARLAALLDGKLTPLSATFSSGGTVLSVAGRGDLTPAFEGRTDIASTDGFAMLDAFGWTVPDLPDGLGARSVDMAGDLTLASAGTVHLRDLSAVLDGNTLAGDVDIDPSGERPRVTATLAAEALDLTGLSRKGQGGETALVAETGWAREGIDVSGLFAVDGDVALATGPVTLGDAVIDETRAVVVLDRGRAVVSLQPVAAYGGTVTGEVVVNGRGGLSVRAGLDLAGLRMQPFLTAFAGWDRLIGTADARIDLLGAGDTAQALVESLDGALSLDLGRGQIDGLDLAGLVRTRDLSHRGEGATTVFDGASATLDVVDGIGTGDLTIDAPVLTVTGTGRVDLGARTLDWRLLPTLRTPDVTVPVTVRGPWDDPDIRPDLEWVARQALEADRDEVEARARAEAEALLEKAEEAARREAGRLAEDLGVEARDDRPVEDVIRERVESELLDLLLGR